MANAEFSRQEQNKNKGFEAGSYRQKAAAAPQRTLTPLQQKLAGLERALPAALRTRAAAGALCAVMVLAAVLGLGGAKLNRQYTAVRDSFVTGAAGDHGYSIWGELNTRANNAANILTTARSEAGVKAEYITGAQNALDAFAQTLEGGSVHELYAADQKLQAAVDLLYADLQANTATPMQMGAVGQQYSEFNNAAFVAGNLPYNEEAAQYNKMVGSFPANLIAGLWGADQVELFA